MLIVVSGRLHSFILHKNPGLLLFVVTIESQSIIIMNSPHHHSCTVHCFPMMDDFLLLGRQRIIVRSDPSRSYVGIYQQIIIRSNIIILHFAFLDHFHHHTTSNKHGIHNRRSIPKRNRSLRGNFPTFGGCSLLSTLRFLWRWIFGERVLSMFHRVFLIL